ncbi:HEPN domain protein [Desulforamulus reducens MI-1]|uniref:HEPN domain protein n=1 Tax=Desulforamulus reducens (strain ATCC BAA-1160 / DSM 100696 / MI-1) TaxID=349161 RepID=A4J1U1_DESRM|nr:HEPN domain-containing protein [Desulforamulus reducens]ABO49044.1 HEPN domain protein [Desulforamulus reducens MI-1]
MIKDLVLWRLEKAEKTFEDAELLLERDSFASAINRYYYAAFYAIRALLATRELDSPKHSGVISLFNREFIKTNLLSKKASKTITKVFDLRSNVKLSTPHPKSDRQMGAGLFSCRRISTPGQPIWWISRHCYGR